jgi:hypothetical protein
MRVICLHEDAVRRLKELGTEIKDLTPFGLDGTPYHLVTATADQARALKQLGIRHEDATPKVIANLPPRDSKGFLYCRGGKIPNGTKLRTTYKSQPVEAEVRGGSIWIEGNRYDNPSSAARAVGHGSVNGWTAWEYYDEAERKWFVLDRLRRKLEKAATSGPSAA